MNPFSRDYKPQLQHDNAAERSRRSSARRDRDLAAGKQGATGYLGPLRQTTPEEYGQRHKRMKAAI